MNLIIIDGFFSALLPKMIETREIHVCGQHKIGFSDLQSVSGSGSIKRADCSES